MLTAIKKKSAFTGQKLKENKLTEHVPIETLPLPEKVVLPMQQHIGAPCELTVKKKDEVLAGQMIAASKGFCSAPIHATISGTIGKVVQLIGPGNSNIVDAVEIVGDGDDNWCDMQPLGNIDHGDDIAATLREIDRLDRQAIIDRAKEMGLVGLGGAAFPTFIKLMKPKDKTIDTLILNGCECEPWITSDHRTMLERAREVLLGFYIIRHAHEPQKAYIAIEDNKPDVIELYCKLIPDMGLEGIFEVVSLRSQYPMGAEKTLIKTIVGREVPMLGLPLDVGCVVQNVTTAVTLWEAVSKGRPLVDRLVTVTGAVKTPKNVLARIGTPIQELIDFCGGLTEGVTEIIAGGPMMGVSVVDPAFPVTKGTNNILARKTKKLQTYECINCGSCLQACPMRLMPLMFVRAMKHNQYEVCLDYHIDDCMECGSCAYGCPANIPIVEYVKSGKGMLRRIKAAQKSA